MGITKKEQNWEVDRQLITILSMTSISKTLPMCMHRCERGQKGMILGENVSSTTGRLCNSGSLLKGFGKVNWVWRILWKNLRLRKGFV